MAKDKCPIVLLLPLGPSVAENVFPLLLMTTVGYIPGGFSTAARGRLESEHRGLARVPTSRVQRTKEVIHGGFH